MGAIVSKQLHLLASILDQTLGESLYMANISSIQGHAIGTSAIKTTAIRKMRETELVA